MMAQDAGHSPSERAAAKQKSIASISSTFDALELIPRAYSINSLSDFCGERSSGGGALTKLDVMAAVAASRTQDGDIGPELLLDYARVLGGLGPLYKRAIESRIRIEVSALVLKPIFSEACATAAAACSYVYAIYGIREPRDPIARKLCVRIGTYCAHAQVAEQFASESLYRAIARFKNAIRNR